MQHSLFLSQYVAETLYGQCCIIAVMLFVFQNALLLDRQRLRVLYMDTGRTGRLSSQFDRLLSDSQVLTCSSNGNVSYFEHRL